MTTYSLELLPSAHKEWQKLGANICAQFEKKLRERLRHPRVPSARLTGLTDCYKIKLKDAGYRLVYRVDDERVVIVVIAVGRRDRNRVYKKATTRLG